MNTDKFAKTQLRFHLSFWTCSQTSFCLQLVGGIVLLHPPLFWAKWPERSTTACLMGSGPEEWKHTTCRVLKRYGSSPFHFQQWSPFISHLFPPVAPNSPIPVGHMDTGNRLAVLVNSKAQLPAGNLLLIAQRSDAIQSITFIIQPHDIFNKMKKIIWHSFILRLLKVILPRGLRKSWKVKQKWHVWYCLSTAAHYLSLKKKKKKRLKSSQLSSMTNARTARPQREPPVLLQLLQSPKNDSASYRPEGTHWWLSRAVNCWNSIYWDGSRLAQRWFRLALVWPNDTGFVFYFYWTYRSFT